MTETAPTIPGELPSSRQLLESTAIAAGVAVVILLTAVLPAEYGIDPTGIGQLLGLKRMGEIKARLEAEAEVAHAAPAPATSSSPATAPPPAPPPAKDDVTRITLQPKEGKEVKLSMRQGARATYAWSTDRGVVSFDLHTDTPDGEHSYRKAKGVASDEGELVAVCDGLHGWFWRKRSSEPLTIALRTVGRLHRGQGAGVVPDSLVLPPGTDRSPIDARAMCWGASAPRSNR